MTTARSRLTPEREVELFDAVLALLREVGYSALTMDAVAARTRSSKATLYRQWGSKPQLVATALQRCPPHGDIDIDTGSLRGDFHALLSHSDDAQMKQDSELIRGLFQAVHEDRDLYEALQERFIGPEISRLTEVVDRAVARGEVRSDNPARELAAHMLLGAFFTREIIDDQFPDREFLTRYIDSVVLPALEA
ncbi:TetR/AcrR family transcriptional regulator [Streptomyces clavuligerus]|uniref:TetR-family transcriptional regulator n=1 Tax=Streptomyces clavuligerus TaxID=1901 RepID=B5GPX4_STRCL|nr:TetR/AcrR family transcriptional regulator [Streptomyces clavuligerus]ANW19774.1 TetR family transcriptional regulator [Streptomyces clavuligerus]AXU14389.1 TetR/AcrR family transcriptional regulator [Streptomyces clavuligerus]EDY48370.1 TetR-family transcriptional regulator [Streptomyces clavuligerus]EFG07375.1 TetR-family transcriptional regulator [Streptomyces clavuligerus]MBY6304396.1 TetR/AcrR family transcriptional regulator [Streptomyces clavuligerus]